MEPLLTEDSEVVSKLLKDSMFSDIDALVRFKYFFPCIKHLFLFLTISLKIKSTYRWHKPGDGALFHAVGQFGTYGTHTGTCTVLIKNGLRFLHTP